MRKQISTAICWTCALCAAACAVELISLRHDMPRIKVEAWTAGRISSCPKGVL